MERSEFEDFLKNWQKILKDFGETISKMSVISDEIAKKITESVKGLELEIKPIGMYWVEHERNLARAMDSMRRNINLVSKAQANFFGIPEAMAENIRELAEGLTQQMKPIVKFLREWQDITKGW